MGQLEPGLSAEPTLPGDAGLGGEATLAELAGLWVEATLPGEAGLGGEATLAELAGLWVEATLAGLAGDAIVVDVRSGRAGDAMVVVGPSPPAEAGRAAASAPTGIEVVVGIPPAEEAERLRSRTTPSGRTIGSSAPAIANPPMPTPTSAPLTAATFQLIRDFCM